MALAVAQPRARDSDRAGCAASALELYDPRHRKFRSREFWSGFGLRRRAGAVERGQRDDWRWRNRTAATLVAVMAGQRFYGGMPRARRLRGDREGLDTTGTTR